MNNYVDELGWLTAREWEWFQADDERELSDFNEYGNIGRFRYDSWGRDFSLSPGEVVAFDHPFGCKLGWSIEGREIGPRSTLDLFLGPRCVLPEPRADDIYSRWSSPFIEFATFPKVAQ